MLERLRYTISLATRSDASIVFVHAQTVNDPVSYFSESLSPFTKWRYFNVHLTRTPTEAFHDHAAVLRLRKPHNLMIVAHALPHSPGFLLADSEVLTPVYWSQCSFQVVYAHACWGGVVLSTPAWKNSLRHWVSYSDEIRWMKNFALADRTWKRVQSKIVKDVAKAGAADALFERVRSRYDHEMMRMSELPAAKNGARLLAMLLMRCRDSLACWEESL